MTTLRASLGQTSAGISSLAGEEHATSQAVTGNYPRLLAHDISAPAKSVKLPTRETLAAVYSSGRLKGGSLAESQRGSRRAAGPRPKAVAGRGRSAFRPFSGARHDGQTMFQLRLGDPGAQRRLIIYAALPLTYVVSGRLGLFLAVPPGYATAVFLPAGIAVAAMFTVGVASLPATLLASFLLNIWIGYSLGHSLDSLHVAAALIIAVASACQAAVGGSLLRRAIGYPARLDSL